MFVAAARELDGSEYERDKSSRRLKGTFYHFHSARNLNN
jgi:hypothetical protein